MGAVVAVQTGRGDASALWPQPCALWVGRDSQQRGAARPLVVEDVIGSERLVVGNRARDAGAIARRALLAEEWVELQLIARPDLFAQVVEQFNDRHRLLGSPVGGDVEGNALCDAGRRMDRFHGV
jgi:hypothetical protein